MAGGLQALADAFSDAPAPNLADTTSGSGLSALAAAFAPDQPQQDDTPAGWTRKGILLINNQTGQAVPAPIAGAKPGLGKVAIPDAGLGDILQSAATSAFGVPLAGAAETLRDAAQRHPTLAGLVAGPGTAEMTKEGVPQGLTQELAQRAQQQQSDALLAHPEMGNAYLAATLGVNLLPMAAGLPAAAESLGAGYAGVGSLGSVSGLAGSAARGAAGGGAVGYLSAYGQEPAERLKAAGQMALLGAGIAAVEGMGAPAASAEPQPSAMYRAAQEKAAATAQASAPPDAPPALVDALVQQELARVDDAWHDSVGMEPPPPANRAALPPPTATTRDGAPVTLADATPPAPAASFETAKGSQYQLFDDGTTQRTRSVHEGDLPTDAGEKPRSEATVYISPEDAQRAGWHTAVNRETNPRVYVDAYDRAQLIGWGANGWGRFGEPIPLSSTPTVGAAPLELWGAQDAGNGATLYDNWHPGNPIVKIETGLSDLTNNPVAPGIDPEAGFVSLGRRGPTPASMTDDQLYDTLRAPFVSTVAKGRFAAGMRYAEDSDAFPAKSPDDFGNDVRGVYEQTGNPLIKGDTYQEALQRVMSDPRGPAAVQDMQAFKAETDGLWQQQNAARQQMGLDPIPYRDNYLNLAWKDDEPWVGPGGPGMQGSTVGVEQPRTYDSLAAGIEAGKVPVDGTVDWAGAKRATREAYAKASALRDLAGNLDELAGGPARRVAEQARANATTPEGIADWAASGPPAEINPNSFVMPLADGRPAFIRSLEAPDGFVRPDPSLPFLNQLLPGEKGNVYVHPALWDNLNPILSSPHVGPIGAAYDALNGVMKRASLMGGFFHPAALTESLINTLGLARGGFEAVKHGFGLPGLAQIAHHLGGTDFSEASAMRGLDYGLTIDPPDSDIEATALGKLLSGVREWGEGTAARSVGVPVAKAAQGVKAALGFLDNALWSYHHLPAKVKAFEVLADKADALRAGHDWAMGPGGYARKEGIRAQPAQEVYRGIARAVNDNFGGQNWQLMRSSLASNPLALQAARRAMLSPDWLTSSARAFASPLSGNPTRGAVGLNYWANAAKLFGLYQLLSKAVSGHYTWENGPGGAFDLHRLMSIDLGPNAKGRTEYWNVGKHFLELPHLLLGRKAGDMPVLGPMSDKLSPPLGSAGRAFGDIKARGDLEKRAINTGEDLAAPFLPISVRNAWKDRKADAATIVRDLVSPFPISTQ